MFDELSVAENIFMGHMPTGSGRLDRLERDARPDRDAADAARERHRSRDAAQARSASRRSISSRSPARCRTMPASSSWTSRPRRSRAREIDDLFRIVAQLKAEGRAILFISPQVRRDLPHRRPLDLPARRRAGRRRADRRGDAAARARPPDGRPLDRPGLPEARRADRRRRCWRSRACRNATEFADISFTLRHGEILGFYGLVGAGRSEAMQCLFGCQRPTRGDVLIDGTPVAIRSPADAIAAGIAYVPEDRQAQGAVLPLGVRENITLRLARAHLRGRLPVAPLRTRRDAPPRLAPRGQGGATGTSRSASSPAATSRRW